MKISIYKSALFTFITVVAFASCVSSKKYKTLEDDRNALKQKYDNLDVKSTEMSSRLDRLNKEANGLRVQVPELEEDIARLKKQIEELEDLQRRYKNDSQKEMRDLLSQIQKNKDELQKKEDELRERNRNLIELQSALNKKDSAVRALRAKVVDALLGFEGKGLTIQQKDGKVYVSMDEKLLFKSGKYDIEKNGITAIEHLARVLEQNTDISIMVEGHTDNVKFSGTTNLNDNWDLSVKRATTVVRALLKGSTIDPMRVIAAGHGEYAPIASNTTAEGKQKNRRTEIILSPKMEELLKILDTQ